MFRVVDSTKYGLLDSNGTVLIEPKYDAMWEYGEGLIPVSLKKKWIYVDSSGTRVLPGEYDAAGSFKGGRAFVSNNSNSNGSSRLIQSVIDKKGNAVQMPENISIVKFNDRIQANSDALIAENASRKMGILDSSGKTIVPFIYKHISPFDERGWAVAVKDTLIDGKSRQAVGIIDKSGFIRIPFRYSATIEPFRNGWARVRNYSATGDVFGMIDTTGKEVIPPVYGEIQDFGNGYFKVKKSEREYLFGLIDSSGKIVTPLRYAGFLPFSNGFAAVSLKDTLNKISIGYINMQGELMIKPQYEEGESFFHGISVVKKNGKYGMIDTTGKEIIPPIFNRLMPDDYFVLAIDYNYIRGMFDLKGNVFLPVEYEEINRVGAYYLLIKEQKLGFMDHNGTRFFKD